MFGCKFSKLNIRCKFIIYYIFVTVSKFHWHNRVYLMLHLGLRNQYTYIFPSRLQLSTAIYVELNMYSFCSLVNWPLPPDCVGVWRQWKRITFHEGRILPTSEDLGVSRHLRDTSCLVYMRMCSLDVCSATICRVMRTLGPAAAVIRPRR